MKTFHGNGLVEVQGKKKTTWGIDKHVDGRRLRKSGWSSREEAEAALGDAQESGNTFCGRNVAGGTLKIGSIGALAELVVCADLLQQGFDVYRSVSINAACDVIAANELGQLCRIEVKSAIHRRGSTRFKRHRFDRTKHDILALVFLREQYIEYSVSLHSWFENERAKSQNNAA